MPNRESDALLPALERATATLKTALGAACSSDVQRADTGELIRIEEVLAIANEAAKEAVSVRRRLAKFAHSENTLPPSASTHSVASREVEDRRGVRWAVFAVHPTPTSGRPVVRERFRDGWLSFDCGEETRRIAPIPASWQTLPDSHLLELCDAAERVRRRVVVPHQPSEQPQTL